MEYTPRGFDPVIKLFEGNFLGRLRKRAQDRGLHINDLGHAQAQPDEWLLPSCTRSKGAASRAVVSFFEESHQVSLGRATRCRLTQGGAMDLT